MSDVVRLSKLLSYVLRHRPDSVGLALDEAGWAPVADVLAALTITREDLDCVVRGSDKQRFAIDGEMIRAQQGHSVPVHLGYEGSTPPDVLWHGTARRFLAEILRDGLRPQRRHAVHLSADASAARDVGARHGRPVVLRVDAAAMVRAGHPFSVSGNGVWLVDVVPPQYLTAV